MREGWPSLTAAAVSVARGVGVPGLPRDEWAERLLPPPLAWVVEAGRTPWGRRALRALSFGTVDHMALRTAAIDRALSESDAEQIVILGAGLDARALRLPHLADKQVFEVDHPDTQRAKRAALPDASPRLHFVGVDFARDDLGATLERAGHDPGRPTFFLWEGVTMYLPRPAIEATLAVVRARAAAGSGLAFTYVVPELVPGLPPPAARLVRLGFRALGEALVGAMTPERARQLAEDAAFEVVSDQDDGDWARATGHRAWLGAIYRGERLLVARRRENEPEV